MTTAELLPTAPAWQMSSFGESRASKALYEQRGAEWALHNSQQISRVYPRGSRIDSDNYDPLPLWNVGVQMAALNWQTHDLPQQLNMSKFSVNDRCGYVLKPPYLRRRPADGEEAGDTRRETPVLEVPTTLTVLRLDILGAVHVPTPGEVGRGDLEPYHFPWWAQAGVRPLRHRRGVWRRLLRRRRRPLEGAPRQGVLHECGEPQRPQPAVGQGGGRGGGVAPRAHADRPLGLLQA